MTKHGLGWGHDPENPLSQGGVMILKTGGAMILKHSRPKWGHDPGESQSTPVPKIE